VHLGHRAVIESVLDRPGIPTVVTFDPHPREYFSGQTGFLLAPGAEKYSLIAALGIEQLVVLPFDDALAATEAEAFMVRVLEEGLSARFVSVGWNFRFGKGRRGTTEVLQAFARDHAFDIEILAERRLGEERVSSSAIRTALGRGDLALAWQLLGRPYSLEGEVVTGDRRGRTLGFATANLAVGPRKFLPADGVYVVRAHWNDAEGWGLMNLGVRPTFAGDERRVEIHLLDFAGDLYGKELRVTLEHHLRSERRFDSPDELIAQIEADRDRAREWIASR
jgi:riboflavin kinase/FMN adenylyltransferase